MWLWDCKTCTDIYLETHDKCVRVGRPVVIHTEASTVSAVKEILYAVTTQFSTCSWSWISLWMDLTMRDLSSAHHVHNSALYVCVHNHQPLLPQYRPDVMCSHSLHRKWLPSPYPGSFSKEEVSLGMRVVVTQLYYVAILALLLGTSIQNSTFIIQ